MDSEKVKQYVPKLRRRLMTQEDCNRINNGGATQIVLNSRVKRPRSNTDVSSKTPTSNVNKDG
jgi:hypothetical protein